MIGFKVLYLGIGISTVFSERLTCQNGKQILGDYACCHNLSKVLVNIRQSEYRNAVTCEMLQLNYDTQCCTNEQSLMTFLDDSPPSPPSSLTP